VNSVKSIETFPMTEGLGRNTESEREFARLSAYGHMCGSADEGVGQ
jgi:hypothetical protein